MSFISKHWRGEYDLPVAYWFNFVALSYLASFLFFWRTNNSVVILSRYLTPEGVYITDIAALCLGVAFLIWGGVGAWRSAGRSMDRGRYAWPAVARLALITAACLFCYNFYASYTGKAGIVNAADKQLYRSTLPSVASVLMSTERYYLGMIPRRLDEITELTNVKAVADELNLYYAMNVEAFPTIRFEAIREKVLQSVCKSFNDVNLLRRGASYHYWYSNGITKHRKKFYLDRKDCRCTKLDEYGDCATAIVAPTVNPVKN